MNYHLFTDDKFIDDFINDAESVSPGENIYLYTFSAPAKHVKSNKGIYVQYFSEEMDIILSKVTAFDKLFVHWYHYPVDSVIEKIPQKTAVYLFFWGGDFLSVPLIAGYHNIIDKFLYDKYTYWYYKKIVLMHFLKQNYCKFKTNSFNDKIFILKELKKLLIKQNYKEIIEERRKFLKRLTGFCHWNKYDMTLIEKIYNVNLTFYPFCYGVGTNFDNKEYIKKQKDFISILLGNSDTLTNNHIEALHKLSKYKNENIKIYCPLNYGNKPYADYIIKKGKEIFGTKFIGMKDFLPRDEYYNLMNNIDIAIMFHNRTQAAGNIFALQRKGVKVYLKEKSTITHLFRDLKIDIKTEKNLQAENFSQFIEPIDQKNINHAIEILTNTIDGEHIRLYNLKKLLK